MDFRQILLIIAIVLVVLIVFAIIIKRKQNKTDSHQSASMEAPCADTINLIEQAKAEALREIEEERSKRTENDMKDKELTYDMLEDILGETFSDITFSSSENIVDNPLPKKKITESDFIKIENHPEDIIENFSVPEDIKSYLSNSYSLSGKSLSDGETAKTNMTIYDGNVRLSTDFDGKNADVILLDGNMYIVNTDKNTYMEITDSFLKLIGKRKEDIIPKNIGVSEEFASIKPKVYSALINNEQNICCEYKSENKTVRLYTKNNSLKFIVTLNGNEKTDIIIKIGNFKPKADKTVLSTDNLKKTNAISFFRDFLK